jgi:16S rRNA (cytidine1402-2'-O)-methyltransferase
MNTIPIWKDDIIALEFGTADIEISLHKRSKIKNTTIDFSLKELLQRYSEFLKEFKKYYPNKLVLLAPNRPVKDGWDSDNRTYPTTELRVKIWKEMVIDDYIWHPIHKVEQVQIDTFIHLLNQGKNIGIISEAGCAGIADPGQLLVAAAQNIGAVVKPYTSPSSLILALMASGMNGQNFQFNGYLPIDANDRKKKIIALENEANAKGTTQLFIETPYRNNQLLEALIQICHPQTRLCLGVDITSPNEFIKTETIGYWKNHKPELHKKLAVFLIGSK